MPPPLPVIHDGRELRVLAALPPRPDVLQPPIAQTHPPLPRDQWGEIDLSSYGPPVLDQGRQSSCVGHAAATVATVAWMQRGEKVTEFSPGFVYAQINGDRDEGAVVSDAALELAKTGVCLMSEVPEGVIYRRQIPQSAYATAQRYRLSTWHHCPDFDSIGTALAIGLPLVGGFLLGNNFMQPGPNGIAPVPDQVVGGHAIALLGLKRINGRWVIKFQNSWTAQWGLRGYGYLGEEFVRYTMQRYGGRLDAFAVESMLDDPQEPLGPVATE